MKDRKPDWERSLPVVCGLADDKGFPYRGKVISVGEGIDPNTHAQRWQALVKNQDGIFMPGMSVRLRLITSAPHSVKLIPADTVFIHAQPKNVVIEVMNERNVIESRNVTLGRRFEEFSSVPENLSANDWVVLSTDGRSYRPETTVKPEKVTTPPPPWASISVPPAVSVAHPVAREVTDYEQFTGHLEATKNPDSIYVIFDIDERSAISLRRAPDRKPGWELSVPVFCGLAGETGLSPSRHGRPRGQPNRYEDRHTALAGGAGE